MEHKSGSVLLIFVATRAHLVQECRQQVERCVRPRWWTIPPSVAECSDRPLRGIISYAGLVLERVPVGLVEVFDVRRDQFANGFPLV